MTLLQRGIICSQVVRTIQMLSRRELTVVDHQNSLERAVSGIDYVDAESRYQLEADDNKPALKPTSSASSIDTRQKQIISWAEDDPKNPYNFTEVLTLIKYDEIRLISDREEKRSFLWSQS